MAGIQSSTPRMLCVLIAGSVLCTTIAGVLLDSGDANPGRHDVVWQRMSIDELIDELVHVGDEGFDLLDVECIGFFVATDPRAECSSFRLSFDAPPAFHELVRRGTAALPGLLQRVTDDRRTQLRLRTFGADQTWADVREGDPAWGPFAGISFDQEYFPRRVPGCNPETRSSEGEVTLSRGVALDHDFRWVDAYTVRVGDLCYVAIGQIVNRRLNSTDYGPENCVTLYSPVQDAVLASAVRRDWSGLTAKAHYESLVNDAYAPDTELAVGAIKRVRFYYPDQAEQLLVTILERRVYDTFVGMDLLDSDLIESGDESKWRERHRQVRERHGVLGASVAILLLEEHLEEVCRSIRFLMRPGTWISSDVGDQREDFERRYEQTSRLLAFLKSEPGPVLPPDELVELWHHLEIVVATGVLKSARVNRAVYESFERTRADAPLEAWMRREVSEVYLARLTGTAYEDDLRDRLKTHATPAQVSPTHGEGQMP